MARTGEHGDFDINIDPPQGIHKAHQWEYDDNTALAAGAGISTATSQIYKLALKTDDHTFHLLTALSGLGVPTWKRVGDGATPGPHAATHATGGDDELTPSDIGAATAGHTHPPAAPAAHASTHYTGGDDELMPSDIGAADEVHIHSFPDISGSIDIGQLPTASAGEVSAVKVPLANDPRLRPTFTFDWYQEDVDIPTTGVITADGPHRKLVSQLMTGSQFTFQAIHLYCKADTTANLTIDIEKSTDNVSWSSIFSPGSEPTITSGDFEEESTAFVSSGAVAADTYLRLNILSGVGTGLTVTLIVRSY